MTTGWTIAVVVAVSGGVGVGAYFLGRRSGRKQSFKAGAQDGRRGPSPSIDPKVAVAAIIASSGAKPAKV